MSRTSKERNRKGDHGERLGSQADRQRNQQTDEQMDEEDVRERF